jgi:hypothetical protein
MTAPCIHGFDAQQCASCHTCPHGLTASRCGRCAAASTTAARRRPKPAVDTPPPVKHAGFEIFYVPEVSGWQYRAPDSSTSALSYRSIFLARKAVDEVADGAKAPRAAKKAS